ncbi:MAG: PhzF family phenazine biosynthesis protein [Microscillaceae bacterium]|nr:PhzF family phenazine biosynthesis protein [Microscillaceae bacterium]
MNLGFGILDTFTSVRFRGNPTGVCVMTKTLTDEIMLSLAKEINFPVTAFIQKEKLSGNHFAIRYFTPTTEIPACGHATLASAGFVFEREVLHQITFTTMEDINLEVRKEGDLIVMTYPKYSLEYFNVSQVLLEGLGVNTYQSAGYCKELETLFLEIEYPDILRNIRPDFQKLLRLHDPIKEIVVTSTSDLPEYDFLLRSFCPWIGIDEDPVTGSVHSVLGSFWQTRLQKDRLKAFQCSERGGELFITPLENKVELGGKVVMVLRGEVCV